MAKRRRVKAIRINYGMFARSNTRKIEKAVEKWMSKGFVLDKQDDHPSRGCLSVGYTLLTFIEREA